MKEIRIDLEAVSLRALTWGPAQAPLAVLLHGFPDTAHSWRHLGPALAHEGWRVVAPFTRGYAPSAVATDGAGDIAALMDDAVGIHTALGGGRDAVLIGHDWGAITANALAAHPDSPYRRVVALSVPPFSAIQGTASIRVLPRQLRNSWYILFNRLPLLPERYLEPLVRKLWRDWSPGYDASGDLPAVLTAMRGPANRRAVIGYYRALISPFGPPAAYRQWKGAELKAPLIPLLYLHGADDGCMDARLIDLVEEHLLPGSVVDVIPGAGHFLQLEQPDVVNARILAYLADSQE